MGSVAILVPVLGRPATIEPLLKSIHDTTPNATVLFLTTESDTETIVEIDNLGQWRIDVDQRERGDYARKINLGVQATHESLIFTAATDLKFHPDWLENAVAKLGGGVKVVGTNDLGNTQVLKGEHSTHTLITRDYVRDWGTIDEPGKIFHEGYPHEFCDTEMVQTAKFRSMWAMAMDSTVEHMHPDFGKAEWDDSYLDMPRRFYIGRRMYNKRRKLWRTR
jgi:hypothetical protein